jgi:hypothetical protein
MKTEKLRVDPQIGPLHMPDSSPSAPLAPVATSTASLDETEPSLGAKQMLHKL